MSGPYLRDSFSISCDPRDVDLDVVTEFLATSYWAAAIPRDVVARSVRGSLCFSLCEGERQIGFARVISDRATFAYLADVFVVREYRGRGLATWLIECVMAHPDLQGLRRWMLATRDAHALYEKAGFTALSHPEVFMELRDPDIYRREA
ncbi:MAG TPA: GNAT family N-acetyltransferase [Gammaproteobacteria bacterium]|nr:GNAT family N-acetyltransferase [Gammaproteobacteria bacterium]